MIVHLHLFSFIVLYFNSFSVYAVDIQSLISSGQARDSLKSLGSGAANSTTGYLTVPGASLYFETYGTDPLLLFISGANGDADIWRPASKILASNYMVCIYDRRGFLRSFLPASAIQNYTLRLQTDATDAKLLIDRLSPEQPATVLGTSSGALVALQLLQMYPMRLKTLIPHEPPALTILPDDTQLTTTQQEIYALYRVAGIPAALYAFSIAYDGTAPSLTQSIPRFSIDSRDGPYIGNNWQYWFEREFLQYPLQEWNLTNIGLYKDKLMLACGIETKETDPQYRSNVVLADKFRLNITMLAGQHAGYARDTTAVFASSLVAALSKRA